MYILDEVTFLEDSCPCVKNITCIYQNSLLHIALNIILVTNIYTLYMHNISKTKYICTLFLNNKVSSAPQNIKLVLPSHTHCICNELLSSAFSSLWIPNESSSILIFQYSPQTVFVGAFSVQSSTVIFRISYITL